MAKAFGIDLGTTFSCVATYDEKYNKTEVLKNNAGDATTPSVVYVESDTSVVVGKQAINQLKGKNARKVVSFAKRLIADDKKCEEGKFENYPMMRGEQLTPTTASSHILKKLMENPSVKNLIGNENPNVVITFPAYFSASARRRTIQAGEIAGLNVLGTIEEPVAAAFAYGYRDETRNKVILVYDLGGGTFDVTVVKFDENGDATVLAKGGDPLLGGVDWDNDFAFYIWSQYSQQCPQKIELCESDFSSEEISDLDKLRKVNHFRRLAQEAKHGLTDSPIYEVSCDDEGTIISVTREIFDDVTRDRLESTFDKLNEVLSEVSDIEISDVLLVGGSTRMPQVIAGLESYPRFAGKIKFEDPDEAVAKGAAIMAYQMAKKLEETELDTPPPGPKFDNISSKSYGIETCDPKRNNHIYISNIICRGDKIPMERTEKFFTVEDNQNSIKIVVYEADDKRRQIELTDGKKISSENNCVRFDTQVPKETPIAVTFRLDESGVLFVSAKSLVDSGHVDFQLQLKGVMSRGAMMAAKDNVANTATR